MDVEAAHGQMQRSHGGRNTAETLSCSLVLACTDSDFVLTESLYLTKVLRLLFIEKLTVSVVGC